MFGCSIVFKVQLILLCRFVKPTMAQVTMEFESNIIHIGDTINITCTVHGVKSIDYGVTRQWSKGPDLVCYNGNPTNTWKYKEYVSGNQFKLQISNITEADLNSKYQCRYQFAIITKTIDEHFEYPPTEDTVDFSYTYTKNATLKVVLLLKKIFPDPNCTLKIEEASINLENGTNQMNGIYFNISYINQLNIRLRCNTELLVTCHLIETYMVANEKYDAMCDTSFKYVWLLCICVILLVFALMILLYCLRQRHLPPKHGKDETHKEVTKSDNSSKCVCCWSSYDTTSEARISRMRSLIEIYDTDDSMVL